ncbi:MAG: hypothetical protein J6T05_06435 [Prevotella sp.]|nr:hypothetical protein [Prevotella sp.]
MKYNKIFSSLLLAVAVAFSFSLQSCKDQPDEFELTDGTPTINYIRPAKASASDSLLVQAYPQATICLVGSNLTSIKEMYFNDQKAILNTSFITDHTLIVQVPSGIPDVVTDKIYIYTSDGQKVEYDFHVVIPAPIVTEMSCEYAIPGSTATIYGSYFVDDPNVPLTVTFPDGLQATIKEINSARSAITIEVPNCTEEGQITVTSIYGSSSSAFRYLDSRGMLFDFETIADGGTGLFSQGWKIRDAIEDEYSLPGCRHYITLGDGSATLDENGGWCDVPFRFDFWCGSWDSPQNITTAPGAALYNIVDFENWEEMSLKFEMCIPSSNAWASGAMQIAFQPIEQVTLSANPVTGYTTVGDANQYIFNGEGDATTKWGAGDWGRIFYRPWVTAGEFHTDGEWITVTLPLADLTLDRNGKAASLCPTKATDFASLTMFLLGGGAGKECTPLLRIDNIRAVPNK